MSTNQSLKTKIRLQVNDAFEYGNPDGSLNIATTNVALDLVTDQLLYLFVAEVEGIIGEDEPVHSTPFAFSGKEILNTDEDRENLYRNILRAEQRSKLSKLGGQQ